MRASMFSTVWVLALACTASCAGEAQDVRPDEIVALERAALDRWGNGDPQGYLDTYAPDVTYFDPSQERRVDGADAMRELVRPITGRVKIDRYELVNPKVQRHGDVGVLTFNLVNYRKQADGSEAVMNRWNSTEVYRRIGGQWKIIHSHWSYTRPQIGSSVP